MFVLRGGGYKAIVTVLLAVMVLCGVNGLAAACGQGNTIAAVGLGLLVILAATLMARWVRAEVRVEPSGLTLRTPFRTHRLTWPEVSGADIVPSNANQIVALVRVKTTEGSLIKVDGVGTRWRSRGLESTAVGHAVQLINTYASRAHR